MYLSEEMWYNSIIIIYGVSIIKKRRQKYTKREMLFMNKMNSLRTELATDLPEDVYRRKNEELAFLEDRFRQYKIQLKIFKSKSIRTYRG